MRKCRKKKSKQEHPLFRIRLFCARGPIFNSKRVLCAHQRLNIILREINESDIFYSVKKNKLRRKFITRTYRVYILLAREYCIQHRGDYCNAIFFLRFLFRAYLQQRGESKIYAFFFPSPLVNFVRVHRV